MSNLYTISSDALHIWCIDLTKYFSQINYYKNFLSQDEINRAERFYFIKHQMRFSLARAFLRKILSFYCGKEAEKIIFSYNSFGRPFLGNTDLQFNISHSDDYAVYAITRKHRIGIDVEHAKAIRDFDDIAERFFSRAEATLIKNSFGLTKQHFFYRIWTIKESFIKALGQGLSYEIKRIALQLEQNKFYISAWHDNNEKLTEWTFNNFYPAENYIAAIAVDNPNLKEVTFQCFND